MLAFGVALQVAAVPEELQTRTVTFSQTSSEQTRKEIATALRYTPEARQVDYAPGAGTISVRGNAEQIRRLIGCFANWTQPQSGRPKHTCKTMTSSRFSVWAQCLRRSDWKKPLPSVALSLQSAGSLWSQIRAC